MPSCSQDRRCPGEMGRLESSVVRDGGGDIGRRNNIAGEFERSNRACWQQEGQARQASPVRRDLPAQCLRFMFHHMFQSRESATVKSCYLHKRPSVITSIHLHTLTVRVDARLSPTPHAVPAYAAACQHVQRHQVSNVFKRSRQGEAEPAAAACPPRQCRGIPLPGDADEVVIRSAAHG